MIIATNAAALPISPGLPARLAVLPAGELIEGRDGRRFKLRDRAALLRALAQREVVVDVNHASVTRAPQGGEAPAQAWLHSFDFDAAGQLTAAARWTPGGERTLADKAYRFVSPALRLNAAGEIIGLHSVGLVNDPNLDLPALNARGADHGFDADAVCILRMMGVDPADVAR